MEIEFAFDQEYHGAHGVDAGIATGLAFGSLKQTIERFQESVGLPCLRPSDDAVEVIANQLGNPLHGFDLGTHDIGTPMRQQGRNDIDLLAIKDLPQLLAIQPGFRSSLGGDMSDQRIQIGGLVGRQLAPVLEQRPAQPFQIGIGLLLDTAHLVHSGRCMCDDMKLVERDAGVGKVVGDPFDKSRRHVDADQINLAGNATLSGKTFGNEKHN